MVLSLPLTVEADDPMPRAAYSTAETKAVKSWGCRIEKLPLR
jgi:hypothetical protein